ncbi:Ferritin-3 [Cardamine amara subsp. amara]|uniref:Ferritin-3 n=1 Tax=Cardamine amara subsp. amara TaxID=228776 RepID=A0ABD1B045_CARAN
MFDCVSDCVKIDDLSLLELPTTVRSLDSGVFPFLVFKIYFFEQVFQGFESVEERDHAEMLMEYQNKRGGRVKLQPMVIPQSESEFDHPEKGDALYAMELALSLEKLVNEPAQCGFQERRCPVGRFH